MDLEQRIARLEAQQEIRELIARYCFTIDARDIPGIGECFTHDGVFRSIDGVMNAQGRQAVVDQFHGRFAVLGPSNHFTHDHTLEFSAHDPLDVRGVVNAHAEVVRSGQALITSLRYHDQYRHEDGRWRFAVRSLEFFYYVAPAQYAEVLKTPLRNCAYPTPHAADYPERLQTWQDYHRDRPPRD
jgi:ketosteroid isomerase-like protein